MFLHDLLGLSPSSVELKTHIQSLNSALPSVEPEIKTYPDAIYFNYYSLGISLLFSPKNGYKPKVGLLQVDDANIVLDSIDIYNIPALKAPIPGQQKATSSRPAELAFSTYAMLPVRLNLTAETGMDVVGSTSGKEFVECLGEPERKGGGAGPSSGSIGIWCEWSKYGIMVEFGGDEAKGPQAWERGKDAIWRVLTIFSPKTS